MISWIFQDSRTGELAVGQFNATQEIAETSSKSEANKYLEKGWQLAAVAAGAYEESKEAYFLYSLVWSRPGTPEHPSPMD